MAMFNSYDKLPEGTMVQPDIVDYSGLDRSWGIWEYELKFYQIGSQSQPEMRVISCDKYS